MFGVQHALLLVVLVVLVFTCEDLDQGMASQVTDRVIRNKSNITFFLLVVKLTRWLHNGGLTQEAHT